MCGSSASASNRRGNRLRDLGIGERPQRQDAAARAQCRQDPRRRMADQKQERALRRLFQHFQQRIGAGAIELIDRIDDGDPPPALARGRAEKRHRLADIVDCDLLMQHAFVVEGPFEDEQIGLRLGGHMPGDRIVGIDRKRRRRLHVAATMDRDARARTAPCDRPASPCRCLADPRSGKHAARGRSDKPRAKSLRQRYGRTIPSWRADAARRRPRHRRLLARGLISGADLVGRTLLPSGAVTGSSLAPTMFQICRATVSRFGAGIDDDAALRFLGGDRQIGLPEPFVEFDVFAFEPVRRRRAAALAGARHADFDRDVEHEREIGHSRRQRRARARGSGDDPLARECPDRPASNRQSDRRSPICRHSSAGRIVHWT